MSAAAVHRIREAGVQRRWHRLASHGSCGEGDSSSQRRQAPNVHNSLAIQKKHVASMYRSWKSLNSHAFGPLNTDPYARHIPIGRVCAQRTSRAPPTETDLGNMYAGSFAFAPGPCEYGVGKNEWAASTPEERGGGAPRTMGCAARKCTTPGEDHPQLPHGKRRDGAGPGPGAYATGDSAVMGQQGGTFAAADERRGAAAALEMAVNRLKTLEWRIGFIRRGVREPEGLRLGQTLVVKTQSGRELDRIEAKASRLRAEVDRLTKLAAVAAAKRDPLPGAFLGEEGLSESRRKGDTSLRRPASTAGISSAKNGSGGACGQGKDRFYDPIPSTATFLESPGPGAYSLTSGEGSFGRAAICRSPSFDLMQRRVVGQQAAAGRSLVSLHLHSAISGTGDGDRGDRNGLGAPFHAYVSRAGPGQYTPDMSAPLLANEGRILPHAGDGAQGSRKEGSHDQHKQHASGDNDGGASGDRHQRLKEGVQQRVRKGSVPSKQQQKNKTPGISRNREEFGLQDISSE